VEAVADDDQFSARVQRPIAAGCGQLAKNAKSGQTEVEFNRSFVGGRK
jgi:hypothetical protein